MHKITYMANDGERTHVIHGVLNGAKVVCVAEPGEEVTFVLNRHEFDIVPFEKDGRYVMTGWEILTWHDVLTFDRDALGPDHPSNKIDEPSRLIENTDTRHSLRVETMLHETKIIYGLAPQTSAELFCTSVESTYLVDEDGEPIPQGIIPQLWARGKGLFLPLISAVITKTRIGT